MATISETCPVCGGVVVEKHVEKIVRGGNDVAVLHVLAGVSTKCGERLYDADTHQQIDRVRRNLIENHHGAMKQVGNVYVPSS